MKKLVEELTLEDWVESMSKRELAVILFYIGTTLVGYAIVGVIIALLR